MRALHSTSRCEPLAADGYSRRDLRLSTRLHSKHFAVVSVSYFSVAASLTTFVSATAFSSGTSNVLPESSSPVQPCTSSLARGQLFHHVNIVSF